MPTSREPIDPPEPEADAERIDDATVEAVREQRRHIEGLDGEDPLRGGLAD